MTFIVLLLITLCAFLLYRISNSLKQLGFTLLELRDTAAKVEESSQKSAQLLLELHRHLDLERRQREWEKSGADPEFEMSPRQVAAMAEQLLKGG